MDDSAQEQRIRHKAALVRISHIFSAWMIPTDCVQVPLIIATVCCDKQTKVLSVHGLGLATILEGSHSSKALSPTLAATV